MSKNGVSLNELFGVEGFSIDMLLQLDSLKETEPATSTGRMSQRELRGRQKKMLSECEVLCFICYLAILRISERSHTEITEHDRRRHE